MRIPAQSPNISWISVKKIGGEEWVEYTKQFTVLSDVQSAIIRFECDCTCGVFLNDNFIISGTGRMPERVNCHEVTSFIKPGENTIRLVLGGAYFQQKSYDIAAERRYWLNSAAFELSIAFSDGKQQTIPSDSTWCAYADGNEQQVIETAAVTAAEYNMMWRNAALWPDAKLRAVPIPTQIANAVGDAYVKYATKPMPQFASPIAIAQTNMIPANGKMAVDDNCREAPYIIYDFGRTIVGFTQLDYTADKNTIATFYNDSSENVSDFLPDSPFERVKKLAVTLPIDASNGTLLNLRRRAFRYLKIVFGAETHNLCIENLQVRLCLFPQTQTGWFYCSDETLNKAWEVGKYTLHINKQQEYESCPRYEMQFFAGDGAIDAWVDQYAFGNTDLMNTSLSIKHDERSTGITYTDKWNRNAIQWDYFAWRIICVHIHYQFTGDRAFLQRYFEECETALNWQLERLNNHGLMFQRPCLVSTFNYNLGQTEWTCSTARLGEKTALNALLYRSLTVMAELANELGQTDRSLEWEEKAAALKAAINTHLWSEEKQAYIDSLDDFIPQDGNVFALLFGIADEKQTNAVLQTLKSQLWTPYGSTILDSYVPHTRGGNQMVSPFMCCLEALVWFAQQRPEDAITLIRRCWGTMIKKGAETFWEFSPNNAVDKWRTPSHAWSSGCTYLLSAYILGIRPTKANFSEILFAPNPCDLTEMRGVVPTARGLIAATYQQDAKQFTLVVPEGTQVQCVLPKGCSVSITKY